jgi:Glycosyl-transferase for dystroglycan
MTTISMREQWTKRRRKRPGLMILGSWWGWMATGCILLFLILRRNQNNNSDHLETSKNEFKDPSTDVLLHDQSNNKYLKDTSSTNKTTDFYSIEKHMRHLDTKRNYDDSTTTIKSTLLFLLNSLPNNTTQREISNVLVRTSQSGKITLSTQGGVSKLPRLADLTSRWMGPISCAMYITTEEQIDVWLDFLSQQQSKDRIMTWVSFHILLEKPQLPSTVNRHPINRLRNLALRNCDTDHVFLNDMDFMPPVAAHDSLLYQNPLPPPKVFWVLPAFERFASSQKSSSTSSKGHPPSTKRQASIVTNVTWIPKTKVELLSSILDSQVVTPFHEYFPAGHAPCNYSRWYQSSTFYAIDYDYLFEPYVIVHRRGLPEFFPTFRGFAFNKMSFFMEAHYRGFRFVVHPTSFVVHMNHEGRKGRNSNEADLKYIKKDFHIYIQQVYQVSKQDLSPRM